MQQPNYVTREIAAALSSAVPGKPLSEVTLRRMHDAVNGPRDAAGRRLFDYATCDAIRRHRLRKELRIVA